MVSPAARTVTRTRPAARPSRSQLSICRHSRDPDRERKEAEATDAVFGASARAARAAQLAALEMSAAAATSGDAPPTRSVEAHGRGHEHYHVHAHNHDHDHDHGDATAGTSQGKDTANAHGAHGHAHDHTHGQQQHHHHHHILADDEPVWRPGSRNSLLQPGALAGRDLLLDASHAGCAGDMLCAALLDLGVPLSVLEDAARALDLREDSGGGSGGGLPASAWRLETRVTERSGVVAPRFVVVEPEADAQPARDWRTIRALLSAAAGKPGLTVGAVALALDAFERLAIAEARCHGTTPDDVHFHEASP